jgi:hypothetical protein
VERLILATGQLRYRVALKNMFSKLDNTQMCIINSFQITSDNSFTAKDFLFISRILAQSVNRISLIGG